MRRLIHDPRRILEGRIFKGETAIDIGCGPGVFTIPMAEMVGEGGKVIAADFQDGMLQRVRRKAEKKGLLTRIILHKTELDRIGAPEKADFALAFYMVHEVPDRANLFEELRTILKRGGRLMVVEPLIHVSETEYERTREAAVQAGFRPIQEVRVALSRGDLFENP
ncbi:MAG: class I SAM-dependent methyltransferase [Candidatus Altiarchaeota archaeon]